MDTSKGTRTIQKQKREPNKLQSWQRYQLLIDHTTTFLRASCFSTLNSLYQKLIRVVEKVIKIFNNVLELRGKILVGKIRRIVISHEFYDLRSPIFRTFPKAPKPLWRKTWNTEDSKMNENSKFCIIVPLEQIFIQFFKYLNFTSVWNLSNNLKVKKTAARPLEVVWNQDCPSPVYISLVDNHIAWMKSKLSKEK